jgi:hypothetical protein
VDEAADLALARSEIYEDEEAVLEEHEPPRPRLDEIAAAEAGFIEVAFEDGRRW